MKNHTRHFNTALQSTTLVISTERSMSDPSHFDRATIGATRNLSPQYPPFPLSLVKWNFSLLEISHYIRNDLVHS